MGFWTEKWPCPIYQPRENGRIQFVFYIDDKTRILGQMENDDEALVFDV